jgi:hypothetical protein
MKLGTLDVPEPDDDPAVLSALYSGFAYAEHWRKIVLASCKEAIRATMALSKQHVTEARLLDLARLHPNYLQFMETHLLGRIKFERNVKDSLGYK